MSAEQLQQALYTALNVSGITAQLGTGGLKNEWASQVVDAALPTAFPFITMTFPAMVPFSDKGVIGYSATVQVDIWDRDNGLRLKVLADDVSELLDRQALGVTGHVSTDREDMQFMRDPDGITRRAMLRFRVLALA
jgi:hypothetical protein